MKKDKLQNHPDKNDEIPDKEIYSFYGETDEEIILQMKKRKDENVALKKLLENLNSTIKGTKSKKNV
jgi:hypothetical protein